LKTKNSEDASTITNPSVIRSALNASLKSGEENSMHQLNKALIKVENALSEYSLDHENDPLLVVVFDEVSSLLEKDHGGRYVALNRIISCISQNHRVWYFFLSTESKLGDMLPPDSFSRCGPKSAQPSYRGNYNLKRYPPLHSSPLTSLISRTLRWIFLILKQLSAIIPQRSIWRDSRR
jgi:hypothetical protein